MSSLGRPYGLNIRGEHETETIKLFLVDTDPRNLRVGIIETKHERHASIGETTCNGPNILDSRPDQIWGADLTGNDRRSCPKPVPFLEIVLRTKISRLELTHMC